jgi:hypothetical protein
MQAAIVCLHRSDRSIRPNSGKASRRAVAASIYIDRFVPSNRVTALISARLNSRLIKAVASSVQVDQDRRAFTRMLKHRIAGQCRQHVPKPALADLDIAIRAVFEPAFDYAAALIALYAFHFDLPLCITAP